MIKKGLVIIIILITIIIFIFAINKKNDEKEMRLRILANSNNDIDIEEKIIVKNIMQEILEDNNYQNISINELESLLKNKSKDLISSSLTIEITNCYYPAKAYEEKFIPSGNYQTLLITIGEGKGNNFWTLLYPDYYDITFEEENEIEYRSYWYDFINNINNKKVGKEYENKYNYCNRIRS